MTIPVAIQDFSRRTAADRQKCWVRFARLGASRAVAVAALCLAATSAAQQTRESLAVSPAQEVALGNNALNEFLVETPTSTDGNLAVRVDTIGQRVARISDRPGVLYRFLVLQGEEVQAWSFPGGTVCVSEGLIRLLDSEDALAFALGHELAHVALRHHIVRYRQLVRAERATGSRSAMLKAVRSQSDMDQEMEADRYGALYAVRANYRFTAALEALAKMARAAGEAQGDAAHPDYARRIHALGNFRAELELSLETFRSGTASLRAGEFNDAIDALPFFVAQFPQSVSGHINLGAAYLARVRKTAPLEVAEVLPILPDPGIVIRGMYDRLDLREARRHFEQALEVEPREAYAQAGVALVHMRLGDTDQARLHLERARELAPNSPEILLCLGNVHFQIEEFNAAELHYRAALSLRPDWNTAKKNIAIVAERLGRIAEARGLWEELISDSRLREEASRRLRDLEDLR